MPPMNPLNSMFIADYRWKYTWADLVYLTREYTILDSWLVQQKVNVN